MRHTQFRSFHAVATEGSVSAAARKLRLSQPTVTTQVRALEAEYGVELFHRRGRSIALTPLGAQLLATTRRLFDAQREGEELMGSASELRSGELRVAAVGPHLVVKVLARFLPRYPDLGVEVTVENSQECLNALLEYRADIAFFAHLERDPRLHTVLFDRHPLVVFFRRDHRWARRKAVRMRELQGERMVLREVGSNTRRLFENALEANGQVEPNVVMVINNPSAIREAVAEGFGVGVIAEHAFTPEPRLRCARLLDVPGAITSCIACLKERRETLMIRAFFGVVGAIQPGIGLSAGH